MTFEEIVAALLAIACIGMFMAGMKSRGTGALGISFGFFAMALSVLAEAGLCLTLVIGAIVTIFMAWILE